MTDAIDFGHIIIGLYTRTITEEVAMSRDGCFKAAMLSNVVLLWANLSDAEDFFPGDIFVSRPPHMRVSKAGENEANPRTWRSFPLLEPPPSIPSQDEIRLTSEDTLTLVYPAHGGSYSSGESVLLDRLRKNGLSFELDLFHIPTGFSGDALVPPSENGLFIGRLVPGDYSVMIRNWYLPLGLRQEFDPKTFEPPSNAVEANGQLFATPWNIDDPPVFTESSFRFTVVAVPESSSLSLAAIATLLIICLLRRPAPSRVYFRT